MEITSGQMCQDLIALSSHVKMNMLALAEGEQLTPIQLFALYAILQGESTMGRVACVLRCDASNVTGIIDRLVSRGLVMRQEGRRDRREKTLQLTEKGRDVIDGIIEKLPAALGCECLSTAERSTLHAAIGKLTA
jgi:DNA-binding MarR family transcriptional regulator